MTWAAVELGMLQRLLDTVSLSDGQWLSVIGLSFVAPLVVAVDKAIQIRRMRPRASAALGTSTTPAV